MTEEKENNCKCPLCGSEFYLHTGELSITCPSCGETVSRPQAEKYAPLGNFLLGGASIWLAAGVGMSVLAVGSAIFWGILPLLILSVAKRKKY